MAKRVAGKGIMMRRLLNNNGNAINWFPEQISSATRSIRHRLSLSHLVIQLRDSRIPVSSANLDLPEMISRKKQIIALNKKDLANPNMMHHWIHHFESSKQNCIPINSHSQSSVKKLLDLVELKLKEVISREPTLLVMVVGVPNVGKSALINSIHEIASQRFPAQDKRKRATVGPLPGVTQDITGFQIAHKPSIYIMDTPGVLAPSIPDLETGLKLALAGSVKDSVVGEERIAQYLLAILNTRSTPLHWKNLMKEKVDKIYDEYGDKHEYTIKDLLPNRRKPLDRSDVHYIEDLVTAVQRTLYTTFSDFDGNVEEETDLEHLIEQQFEALQRALKIPQKGSEARIMVSKKFLTLFRTGKLGPFILDDVPNSSDPTT